MITEATSQVYCTRVGKKGKYLYHTNQRNVEHLSKIRLYKQKLPWYTLYNFTFIFKTKDE